MCPLLGSSRTGFRGCRNLRASVLGACAVRSWAAEATDELPPSPPVASDLLSPGALLGLGFSFVAGLAIGYALKVAFKVALLVGGLLLILLFALQYSDLVEVNWAGIAAGYDGLVGSFSAYGGALRGFMAKNLPNAASFTAGLLLGLRF